MPCPKEITSLEKTELGKEKVALDEFIAKAEELDAAITVLLSFSGGIPSWAVHRVNNLKMEVSSVRSTLEEFEHEIVNALGCCEYVSNKE